MHVNSSSEINIDATAFAVWVKQVAIINEDFSEILRDTADAVALNDPTTAVALYRAADSASESVQRLRRSLPPPRRQPSMSSWLIFGLFCAGVGAALDRLRGI